VCIEKYNLENTDLNDIYHFATPKCRERPRKVVPVTVVPKLLILFEMWSYHTLSLVIVKDVVALGDFNQS
jgi:hypothetical protein